MDIQEAKHLAIAEMNKWGLIDKGWHVSLNTNKRRLGYCSYIREEIGLSRSFVLYNNESEVMDTIRHEIAHALAGLGTKHGRLWKLWAKKVGCTSVRATASASTIKMPKGKWTLTCKMCGHSSEKHRASKLIKTQARGYYCTRCGRRSINMLVVTQNY